MSVLDMRDVRKVYRSGDADIIALDHATLQVDHGEIVEDAVKDDFFGSPRSERAQQFLSKILSH